MGLKGFVRHFKPLEILTEGQLEAIYKGTLEVLWRTGVSFEHEKALKLLTNSGCKVDYDGMRVRIPPALVEESIRKCPSNFCVGARDCNNDLIMGGDNFYFGTAPGMQTIDLHTWEPRVATRKENYDGVTILDALSNVHMLSPYTPYFGFQGVPPVMAMTESFAARIRNSTKCVCANSNNNSDIFAIEMAKAVGCEILGIGLISPPLTIANSAIEAIFRFAEAGFPIRICSGPVMGATAPATIAGSTIVHNVEVIAALVLIQIIKPGTRVVIKDFIFPQNMRSGSPVFGAIETCLHNAIFNQFFRKYSVPTGNTNSFPSSKIPDYQCGYEKANLALIAALSGANYTEPYGSVHGELTFHPVQAILDDDLAGMIGRFLEGVTINAETLALDVINEVIPVPGHFLGTEHTRKWWKLEHFVPKVADRLTYSEWHDSGKKSCLDYAKQKMEEILATHKPIRLTQSQEEDIEKILEEARQYYKKIGLISEEEMAIYTKSMQSPNYPYE